MIIWGGGVNGNYEVNETQVESKENDIESHGENESVNGGVDENLDVGRNENEEGINDNGKVNAGSNTDSIGKDNDTSKNAMEIEDKNEERSMEEDEVTEQVGSKTDMNCVHMSHVEGNLKGKNGDQENNGGASDDSTPMDTAKPKSVGMNNNSSYHTNHVNMDSYAKAVGSSNSDLDKHLFFLPTGINDNGKEAVIFEEDLVSEGCMNYVINQSPWMVKGKPLIVQKWDPSVNIEKVDPCKIPIWSRLVNVLLEAWTPRGISTLASSSSGMEANKGLPDKIEVVYKDIMNKTTMTKFVRVEYDWKPVICNTCGVFGHRDSVCRKRKVNTEENGIEKEKGANANNGKGVDMECWD
ncbi:RNA-directed DNA polymerase, eukaryota, reverse transcriptase zinc-binding domain protein [Tanacetum coccineum]